MPLYRIESKQKSNKVKGEQETKKSYQQEESGQATVEEN